MAVSQFILVPCDIDEIWDYLGNVGPSGVLTIRAILTCGRFTVEILMNGRYANCFLNWRHDFV